MADLKRRRREAQAAFKNFRRTLQSKRDLLERAEDAHDWNELVHRLYALQREYGPELPEEIRHKLDEIANMTDTSPEKIIQTYSPLGKAVAKAIGSLDVGLSTPAIIGIIIGAIAAIGGGAAAIVLPSFIAIDISNNGCSPMDLSRLPSYPLVQSDGQTIDSGQRGQVRISKILNPQIDVQNKVLEVQLGGSFPFPANADEIWYDGQRILQKSTLDKDGILEIICR